MPISSPSFRRTGFFIWVTVMARQLLLVRHATIASEYAGRYVGSTDVGLEEEGIRQAEALASLIGSRHPARCFSSPLLRARQTAEAISRSTGLDVEIDHDLREVDFGRWEARTFEEISAAWPGDVSRWAEMPEDFSFPGGESISGFSARVRRAADRMAADPAEVVVAVTHGGMVRGMICHLLGLEFRHYILFNVRRAACATIDIFDGAGVLSGLNETPALEGK